MQSFAGYRKFIILRDPFDRIVSFINNTYKEVEYDYLFNKSLPPEKYVDSVLRMFPYMIHHTRPDRRYDKHAIPQRVYYEMYKQVVGDELEIVNIKDLPEYYQQLTGHPLIKNNVTKPSEKVCTRDSLTPKQVKLINEYIDKYEFGKDDEFTRYFKRPVC